MPCIANTPVFNVGAIGSTDIFCVLLLKTTLLDIFDEQTDAVDLLQVDIIRGNLFGNPLFNQLPFN